MILNCSPLVEYIAGRISRNKNAIIIFNGSTGSGKSYAAIDLAQELAQRIGTNFKISTNLDFNFAKLLHKMVLPENTKPGTPFVFEETGAVGGGASSREWQSQANKFFFSFMQTSRHKQQILILNCPNFSYLDKGARELCHVQIEMLSINPQTKRSFGKPYILQVNRRTGQIYFKFLRLRINGLRYRYTKAEFKLPDTALLQEYEVLKTRYTTALNNSIMGSDEPKEAKRECKVEPKLIYTLLDKGLTNAEVARMCKISPELVKYHKKKRNQVVKT